MYLPYRLWTPVKETTIEVNGELVELSGEDVRPFFQGPDYSCEGVDTWDIPHPKDVLGELCNESGVVPEEWVDVYGEMEEELKISEEYEKWLARENGENMDDLHEPSCRYSQATGSSNKLARTKSPKI